MPLANLLDRLGRIFIVPIDHPLGKDTPRLVSIGKQNFVDSIDYLAHDGYIFHSRDYIDKPFKTGKDFFLTVGELPDNYLFDLHSLRQYSHIRHLTIFFDVKDENDDHPYQFYKDYVAELKKRNYFVMGMGFPAKRPQKNLLVYQHIADIAYQLGCDALKTDLFDGVGRLDLKGMKLFIGGGPYIPKEEEFDKFIDRVEKLKIASCSFGRNIFEANNYKDRIAKVLTVFGRKKT